MSDLAEALTELGMAFECDPPDFPWSEFDDLQDDPDHFDKAGHPMSPRAKELFDRVQHVRSAHGSYDRRGIPEYKLWVDEGYDWHVTQQECSDAIEIYDAAMADGEEHPSELADDVIPFLRLAAQCNGFTVE